MRIFIYPNPLRYFLLPVTVAIVTFGIIFSSCTDHEQESAPVPDRTAVIYLNFKTGASTHTSETHNLESPGTRVPLTRAVDENGINTVDVLSFKVDPADPTNMKKGIFFYRSQGVYDAATQSVRVRLLSDAAAQTLVVLANVRQQVDALSAAYGEQKETVMGRLLLPATSDKMPDLTSGMPMWGELPVQAVNETYAQSSMTAPTVTMIRSLVKVSIENKVPATIPPHWSGGIYVSFAIMDPPIIYNYRANGRISPDNFNATAQTVFAPTVPTVSGTVLPRGTHINNPPWQDWGQLFSGSRTHIYLFEMDNSSAISSGSALDGCCLVVRGLSNDPHYSASGYYRIDLKDYDTNMYFDLKRNYEYQIQILEIPSNPGASSPDEAFKGNYNLKCKIIPWNEVQEEVIVEGNKRLKVDKREFVFPGDIQLGTASLPVNITTENTNWQISGQPSWISLSQVSGTAGIPATVTISANSKNFSQNTRSAVLSIRTGNSANELEYRLHVSQQPACGFGNSMKLMRIGGNDYQTTRMGNGGVCWMIDASKEGGPNMAARPRTNPFTAAIVGPIYWGNIPHRACPEGWRLPTVWEVINLIQSTTNHYPAVFNRLVESGVGIAGGIPPALSAPSFNNEATLGIWTQTPMIYSSPQQHSPASVLHVGGFWNWKAGSFTETEFRYVASSNRWALIHSAGTDIHSPSGLPANFKTYYGYHYLNGGSVRCVHD